MTLPQSDALVIESLTVTTALTVGGAVVSTAGPVSFTDDDGAGATASFDLDGGSITMTAVGGGTAAVSLTGAGVEIAGDSITFAQGGDIEITGGIMTFTQGGDGVKFGSGADASTLSVYNDAPTPLITLSGPIAATDITMKFINLGGVITAKFPGVSDTGNGSGAVMSIPGAVPPGYRPNFSQSQHCRIMDNGVVQSGIAVISTTGDITISHVDGSPFSGASGVGATEAHPTHWTWMTF